MSHAQEPSLTFLGATGTVTGSRYLVEAGGQRLLVDCGLFQGYKQLRLRNWNPFPVDPKSISAVLLTHAHLDHSGYLPALVRNGFSGPIYATTSTVELCELLLLDSAHLQEEEAGYARRKAFSRHRDPKPLYTLDDAQAALERFEPVSFEQDLDIGEGLGARFIPAGHLLGAASIHLSVAGRTVHFSGDIGRPSDAIMRDPHPFPGADILIVESTYGNRSHPHVDAESELEEVINRVAKRGGTILVPAFAVGRVQAVMLHIARLRARGAIPPIPVYLNTPMGVNATRIYHRHHEEHEVSRGECKAMFELAQRVRTVEESKALNRDKEPKIIISASGMLSGGRILHHVVSFGDDPRNAIVLSGFQAGGTRGAALVRGDRTLRIFGRDVPIAAEVVQLEALSGHADTDELLAWMGDAPPPSMTYVTHGEPEAADALRFRVDHELGWNVRVPEHLERINIMAPE
ncbi:MBL fold metallo-hydrolase RNA specificity domain-containing protein [Erythrobacter mangrovi]|uniref:MBL fold metallo-hydrolase n=1 Tax=Erythrobacter mangrovi TaxID=2739433 RepID=A0A7D4BQ61_9SPHN|nr:MBL fold metallo-hydrolase [Erythrobacter mangrovi]QKG72584.1 MBL fold metallo-hydrolase [Erythrobacter mangrovi]